MKIKPLYRVLALMVLAISAGFFFGGIGLASWLRMEWAYHQRDTRMAGHAQDRLELTQEEFKSIHYRTDELLFKGRLFDIRDVQFIGNRVVVTGHFDDEESYLKAWTLGKDAGGKTFVYSLSFFFNYHSKPVPIRFLIPENKVLFSFCRVEELSSFPDEALRPPAQG
jgi:hypothetical protein